MPRVHLYSDQEACSFNSTVTLSHMERPLQNIAQGSSPQCSNEPVIRVCDPKLKIKAYLPSSSSSASSSAFLSLSCIITRLAREAKVRFTGAVEGAAGGAVEAAAEEGDVESVGVLGDVEEADESLEKDEFWGI